VLAVAPLLLEVEDEGTHLGGADSGGVGRNSLGVEEGLQGSYAAGDNLNGPGASALGPGV